MSKLPAVILASAGSGKTHELAGRYIGAFVEPSGDGGKDAGGGAERILATTFTRKAAGEMFAKVLMRLLAASDPKNEKARAELKESTGQHLTADQARKAVIGLVRRMDRVRVQTLDSFFAEIGRVFAPELGLTPGWRILDEVEIEEAKEEAIDRVCERVEVTTLLTIIEKMNGGALPMLPREELLRRANELHEAFLESGAVADKWGVLGGDQRLMLAKDAIKAALKELKALPEVKTGKGEPNKLFTKARDKIAEAIESRDWRSFLENTLVIAVQEGKPAYAKGNISDEITQILKRLASHAAAVEVEDLAEATRAAGGLARAFDAAYQEVKQGQNAMTFDDLPRAILSLPREDSEWLSFRMDSKLDHILLDEFQDTSRVQYLVLEPLLREITSQSQPGRSVFAVGDVKQSLYEWRGGVPELLAGLSERLGLGEPGTRAKSWRSSAAVLNAVNSVFEQIDANAKLLDFKTVAKRWKRSFQKHTAARNLSGRVRLLQVRARDKDRDKEETVADLVISEAVERVAAITKEHPDWSIGVLTRTNAPIPRLIHRLKNRGILAAQDKGHPLTDEPCINALISLLQLAEHPGDTASQYHVAKTAFARVVGMSSALDTTVGERVSSEVRGRIARDGIAGLVSWLREELRDQLTARGRTRLEHAERLAAEFDASATGRIPEFIRLIEDAAVSDPSAGRASVLTIHRAKGLEWDAVVLIDLERSWKGRTPRVVLDRGEPGEDDPLAPVEAVTLWPRAELQACDGRLKAIADRYRSHQVREELSGLYVSMTRAKSRLEMLIANVNDQGESLTSAAVLRTALAGGSSSEEAGEIGGCEVTESATAKEHENGKKKPGALQKTQTSELKFVADASAAARGKSPSKRKAEAGVREILRSATGHAGARQLGHVWHAWMEAIEWKEDWKFDRLRLLSIAAELGVGAEVAGVQIDLFTALLDGPLGTALSRGRYAEKADELRVRREWGLVWKEDGVVSGRIDRLVIGLREGRPAWAEVVDFKTDKIEASGAEKAAEGYREQIAAYRAAAAKALRLPIKDVRGVLLFTHPSVLIEMK